MGLFDFWKKKIKEEDSSVQLVTENENNNNKTLLAMPIFTNDRGYDLDKVTEHLKSFWNFSITNIQSDNGTAIFDLNGIAVVVGYIAAPIPEEEFSDIISHNYTWRNIAEDLKNQTGHAIVSILGNNGTIVERHILLTKLLCSIMMTSENCIGVYQGSKSLLLQKEHYLASIDDIKNNRIPIPAWIYIGLRSSEDLYDAYTYGMADFNKPEIEIIGSQLRTDNLYKLILNITTYMISNDIIFEDGDLYKISDNVALNISFSKGVYLEGTTLKIEV